MHMMQSWCADRLSQLLASRQTSMRISGLLRDSGRSLRFPFGLMACLPSEGSSNPLLFLKTVAGIKDQAWIRIAVIRVPIFDCTLPGSRRRTFF